MADPTIPVLPDHLLLHHLRVGRIRVYMRGTLVGSKVVSKYAIDNPRSRRPHRAYINRRIASALRTQSSTKRAG